MFSVVTDRAFVTPPPMASATLSRQMKSTFREEEVKEEEVAERRGGVVVDAQSWKRKPLLSHTGAADVSLCIDIVVRRRHKGLVCDGIEFPNRKSRMKMK